LSHFERKAEKTRKKFVSFQACDTRLSKKHKILDKIQAYEQEYQALKQKSQ
jgi:hypothetical protein